MEGTWKQRVRLCAQFASINRKKKQEIRIFNWWIRRAKRTDAQREAQTSENRNNKRKR